MEYFIRPLVTQKARKIMLHYMITEWEAGRLSEDQKKVVAEEVPLLKFALKAAKQLQRHK